MFFVLFSFLVGKFIDVKIVSAANIDTSKSREIPPVVPLNEIFPLLETYDSFDDYFRIVRPLLLLDTWESVSLISNLIMIAQCRFKLMVDCFAHTELLLYPELVAIAKCINLGSKSVLEILWAMIQSA